MNQNDALNAEIVAWKKTYSGLAFEWHERGEISIIERDEIVSILTEASPVEWRPYIYVIPYADVKNKVTLVPRAKRASTEPEYVIENLNSNEFEIIEPFR